MQTKREGSYTNEMVSAVAIKFGIYTVLWELCRQLHL